MMKLSVAIADKHALPSAFVVWRGFEESIAKAAQMGYDGVELALKNAAEVDRGKLDALLAKHGMAVSCISTGQVFADTGLMFTDPDPEKRKAVKRIFMHMIDLAEDYGNLVNIGRVRGVLWENDEEDSEKRFIETAVELCAYAQKRGVTLMLEPVNRYELNFINSVSDGVALLNKMDAPNMKLMPDVFHMNIEDQTIGGELSRHIDHIAYIHLADSNRLSPGQGHIDFDDVFTHLRNVGYDGWLSVEILPRPDPDTAARNAVEFLKGTYPE